MSFFDLNITKILEDLNEENVAVADQLEQVATSTIQIQAPPRPKKCCKEGCKKKLMLSDFPCKCSQIFCSAHRMPEVHDCSFDFKKAATDELKKRLGAAVIGKKVDTI